MLAEAFQGKTDEDAYKHLIIRAASEDSWIQTVDADGFRLSTFLARILLGEEDNPKKIPKREQQPLSHSKL